MPRCDGLIEWLKAQVEWVKKFVSDDPNASMKRLAYGSVVCSAIGWLSKALWHNGWHITPEWNQAFITLSALVGGGYVFKTFAERKNGPSDNEGSN